MTPPLLRLPWSSRAARDAGEATPAAGERAGAEAHGVAGAVGDGTGVSERAERAGIRLTHLQRLEAESIYIMREVVAQAEKPVMLYSIGKDSSVMLRLALKAFYPGKPPFPFLHVDTTWKFRDMYAFRDDIGREHGLDLIVYTNQEGL